MGGGETGPGGRPVAPQWPRPTSTHGGSVFPGHHPMSTRKDPTDHPAGRENEAIKWLWRVFRLRRIGGAWGGAEIVNTGQLGAFPATLPP